MSPNRGDDARSTERPTAFTNAAPGSDPIGWLRSRIRRSRLERGTGRFEETAKATQLQDQELSRRAGPRREQLSVRVLERLQPAAGSGSRHVRVQRRRRMFVVVRAPQGAR